jgi:nitrate reductase NapA
MMAPDYAHWHGMYEVAERFYMQLVPQGARDLRAGRGRGPEAQADAGARRARRHPRAARARVVREGAGRNGGPRTKRRKDTDVSNPLDRRTLFKTLGAAGASVVAFSCSDRSSAQELEEKSARSPDSLKPADLAWSKAPCRFCGTGCGLEIGVHENKVVAVRGDEKSPVNRGLLCVKGYHTPALLYGADRLLYPQLRQPDGSLKRVTWDEALALIAQRFGDTLKRKGPEAVAMYGSGQWTVFDGYAALKWVKAGMRSNNLDPNARLCMSSAVMGFMTQFQSDEPMGCYDDFEAGHDFLLWGNNMAEMHPVLFSRILETKRKNPSVRIVDIATRRTPTSGLRRQLRRVPARHRPRARQRHPAPLGRERESAARLRGRELRIQTRRRGPRTHRLRLFRRASERLHVLRRAQDASFDDFVAFLAGYAPAKVAEITGVSEAQIGALAEMYGDQARSTVQPVVHGCQPARARHVDEQPHHRHPPGNGQDQPARQQPLQPHGPALGLRNRARSGHASKPLARRSGRDQRGAPRRSREDLGLARGHDSRQARPARRRHVPFALARRCRVHLDPDHQPLGDAAQPAALRAQARRRTLRGRERHLSDADDRRRRSDPALRGLGRARRRVREFRAPHAAVEQARSIRPGEAREDAWQIIQVAKRMGMGQLFPWPDDDWHAAMFEEYRKFGLGHGKDLASYAQLKETRGMVWPWSTARRPAIAMPPASIPMSRSPGRALLQGHGLRRARRDSGCARTIRPRKCRTATIRCGCAPDGCSSTGTAVSMTRRIPQLHQAVPHAYVEINRADATALGVKSGDKVRLVSRRGKLELEARVDGRGQPPRGSVFVPFFDESVRIKRAHARC